MSKGKYGPIGEKVRCPVPACGDGESSVCLRFGAPNLWMRVCALLLVAFPTFKFSHAEEVFYPIYITDKEVKFKPITSAADISGLSHVKCIILSKEDGKEYADSLRRYKPDTRSSASGGRKMEEVRKLNDLFLSYNPVSVFTSNSEGRVVARIRRNETYYLLIQKYDDPETDLLVDACFRFIPTRQGMLLVNLETVRAEAVFRMRSAQAEKDFERQYTVEYLSYEIESINEESAPLVERFNEIHESLQAHDLSSVLREKLIAERKELAVKLEANLASIEEYEETIENQQSDTGIGQEIVRFRRLQTRPVSRADF